jgi:hypothetical protein
MAVRALYVTWDGPQVSYLEGLFLPIFAGLRAHDIEIDVLQFTWGPQAYLERQEQVCDESGVAYHRVIVPKAAGGLGSYLSAVMGSKRILQLRRDGHFDVIIPRSVMPAIATLHADWRRSAGRAPMLFDADGLAIDEKVDAGQLSPSSLSYKMLKWYERSAISAAAAVIGRTERACEIYRTYDAQPRQDKYIVAVNGRDPTKFKPSTPAERELACRRLEIDPLAPIIVYSGSFGEKYCPPQMFQLFRAILQLAPNARFLIMSGSPEDVLTYVRSQHADLIPTLSIKSFTSGEVAGYLAVADLGICFYKDTFANQAFQATKLGEYLLCGLATAGTPNAMRFGLSNTSFARTISTMSQDELEAVAHWFVNEVLPARASIRNQARDFGLAHLTTDKTVSSYAEAIKRAIEYRSN